MSLDDLVNVQISKQSASVARTSFGTPIILSAEADVDSKFVGAAKVYTALSQLGSTGDNYDTDGVTYLMAQKIFSQNPKVSKIYIGKRANHPLMTIAMTPIVQNSTAYTITIGGKDGAPEVFTYTSDASALASEITAGIVALINAGTQDVLATDVGPGTSITIQAAVTPGGSATAGKPFTIQFDRALWAAQNTTADPGVVTDLTTIRTSVSGTDDFYAIFLDSFGKAEITALAAEVETLKKIYLPTTFDADVLTSATTDIGSVLQDANYARTALSWHETPGFTDLGAAWAGKCLPSDPGSITWMFKQLAGVAASTLSASELAFLTAKSVNYYIETAGVSHMEHGVTASGEYLDVTRGIDFIQSRIQENVYSRLVNLAKIPFTDKGIAIVESEVRGMLRLGVSQGIFAEDPEPVVTAPRASAVDANDKANRLLPDVTFTATLAGAIHAVEVSGIVTV